MMLQDGLIASAVRTPDAEALVTPDERMSYGALDKLANQIGRELIARGVKPGDRVGIWLEKSAKAVATMQATLRIGAAYVPVDPLMPEPRARLVLTDCAVSLLVTSSTRLVALAEKGWTPPATLIADTHDWQNVLDASGEPLPAQAEDPQRLAYCLYTSGSTGAPKGVCISHRNALAFIDWAVETAGLTANDRLSNHAPFHFDLSVFDLYGAFAVGATVILLPDSHSFIPEKLVNTLVEEQITVWYSVPSVLILMVEQAGLLTRKDLLQLPLRVIFFAGEPFPLAKLRPLRTALSHVRFLNLYGPTETNVCTAYEVEAIDPERTAPVPIGGGVSGNRVWAKTDKGAETKIGEEGELIVEGPTVMLGYWGCAPQQGSYATGDIVRRIGEDNYEYIGRRDAMLKVRGYRIEADEIEAVLRGHPAISDCAVTTQGSGMNTRLVAFLVLKKSATRPSLISVKTHISNYLPRYMNIDRINVLDAIPRNRNGKTDRRKIAELTFEKEKKDRKSYAYP